jgi:hypothetical protein
MRNDQKEKQPKVFQKSNKIIKIDKQNRMPIKLKVVPPPFPGLGTGYAKHSVSVGGAPHPILIKTQNSKPPSMCKKEYSQKIINETNMPKPLCE